MPDTPADSPAPMTETQAEARAHTADALANAPRTGGAVSGGGTTFVSVLLVSALTLVLIALPFFVFGGLRKDSLASAADSTRNARILEQDSMAQRLQAGGEVRDENGRVVGRTLPIDSVIARMATAPDSSAAAALVGR